MHKQCKEKHIMKSKITALILIAALAVSLFAGCSSEGSTPASTPSDTSAATSTPADSSAADTAADSEPLTYTTFDYKAAFASNDPDAVVLTVNGTEITWEEYFGWIYSMVEQYEMYLGTEFLWTDAFSETMSFEEYAKFYAETMCSQYAVVNQQAQEYQLELDDEEKQYIEDLLAADAENYAGGDIDAFIEYLEATFMSEEYYRYINTVAIYYQKLFETVFGENGETVSDAEVQQFIDDNGYLYAKHILFMTVDESGNALDDTAKAEKLAQAEDVIAQLEAISDADAKLAKFDELMMSLSEDTGLTAYPDGYYFVPGEMVAEFEEGTKALEFNAISDIIETSYGYHIILRLPITPESEYQEGTNFRYMTASYAFDNMMSEKFNGAEIIYSDEFASISLDEIFSKIELEY